MGVCGEGAEQGLLAGVLGSLLSSLTCLCFERGTLGQGTDTCAFLKVRGQ